MGILDAPVLPQLALTRIDQQAAVSGQGRNSKVAARYADATGWTEDWTNLTAWTVSGAAVTANTMNGAPGASRAISVPTGGRFVARLTLNKANSTQNAYVGVNSRAAGAAPTAGDAQGFYIGVDSSGKASCFNGIGGSVTTALSASALANGTYLVTITVTDLHVSLSLRAVGSQQTDYSVSAARSAFTTGGINNIAMSTGGSGNTWGPITTVTDLIPPKTKTVAGVTLVGGDAWTVNRVSTGGVRHIIQVPPNYDPRSPAPLVVFMHNASVANATTPYDDTSMANVTAALSAAGYLLVSSDNGTSIGAHGGVNDKYGNQAGLDDYADSIAWSRANFAVSSVFLLGVSQGGNFVLNMLAQRKVGGISGAAMICPSTDLITVVNTLPGFAAAVLAAYGAADATDLVTKIKGYNPSDQLPAMLRGAPLRWYVASADPTCPPAVHVTPVVAKVAPYAAETNVVTVTSSSHVPAAAYQGSDIVSFFDTYK